MTNSRYAWYSNVSVLGIQIIGYTIALSMFHITSWLALPTAFVLAWLICGICALNSGEDVIASFWVGLLVQFVPGQFLHILDIDRDATPTERSGSELKSTLLFCFLHWPIGTVLFALAVATPYGGTFLAGLSAVLVLQGWVAYQQSSGARYLDKSPRSQKATI